VRCVRGPVLDLVGLRRLVVRGPRHRLRHAVVRHVPHGSPLHVLRSLAPRSVRVVRHAPGSVPRRRHAPLRRRSVGKGLRLRGLGRAARHVVHPRVPLGQAAADHLGLLLLMLRLKQVSDRLARAHGGHDRHRGGRERVHRGRGARRSRHRGEGDAVAALGPRLVDGATVLGGGIPRAPRHRHVRLRGRVALVGLHGLVLLERLHVLHVGVVLLLRVDSPCVG